MLHTSVVSAPDLIALLTRRGMSKDQANANAFACTMHEGGCEGHTAFLPGDCTVGIRYTGRDGAFEVLDPDGDPLATALDMLDHEQPGDVTPLLRGVVNAVRPYHVMAVTGSDDWSYRFEYCERCSGHPKWPCPPVAAVLAVLEAEEADLVTLVAQAINRIEHDGGKRHRRWGSSTLRARQLLAGEPGLREAARDAADNSAYPAARLVKPVRDALLRRDG